MRKLLLVVFILLFVVVPVMGQEDIISDDPFMTFENIMQLAQFAGLIVVSLYVIHVIGDSIPASKIEQMRTSAAQTPNPFDDMAVQFVEWYQQYKLAEDTATDEPAEDEPEMPGKLSSEIAVLS